MIYAFNGKIERNQRPNIMTLTDELNAYDTKKEKKIVEFFNSNGDPMFEDTKFVDTYVHKMPIGMESKYVKYTSQVKYML